MNTIQRSLIIWTTLALALSISSGAPAESETRSPDVRSHVIAAPASPNPTNESEAVPLIHWLLEDKRDLDGIPFSVVVQAASGRKLIPMNPGDKADQELLARISGALDRVIERMNAADHVIHRQARINEVSSFFEDALRDALNRSPGFQCDIPPTAEGKRQRSGYPDLRLLDRESGRVIYLDPKLYDRANRSSSLRTFYFEPRRATNKILSDAHHLLIGFEHSGRSGGRWRFERWEIVDLANVEVKLKAEFQTSNRNLYQNILRSSSP
jgi:hypothetical protein